MDVKDEPDACSVNSSVESIITNPFANYPTVEERDREIWEAAEKRKEQGLESPKPPPAPKRKRRKVVLSLPLDADWESKTRWYGLDHNYKRIRGSLRLKKIANGNLLALDSNRRGNR